MKKRSVALMMAGLMVAAALTGCGKEPNQEAERVLEEQEEEVEENEEEPVQETEPETEETEEAEDGIFSNGLFSITLPEDVIGLTTVEMDETSIRVCDKESADAGFGGFAFGVIAFESNADLAVGNFRKIGELYTEDGKNYVIALYYPSDVQFDYVTYTDGMPENYERLYNGAEEILESLCGAEGALYEVGAGMHGEDLYGDVIEAYATGLYQGWDSEKFSEEGMSFMFATMAANGMDKAGYAYRDINHDGIDELLVGEIAEEDWKGTIYDIYTTIDGEPVHVVSGWDRNRYYVDQYGTIINEYSDRADLMGYNTYWLEPNTTNLEPQLFLKIDGSEAEPWMVSFDEGESWESVSEEEFAEYFSRFSEYERFDFTPIAGTGVSESMGLVYEGGLYISDPENDLTMALFRNLDDGDIVAIVTKNGMRWSSSVEIVSGNTLDDGTEYNEFLIGRTGFGYVFGEDGGILIDEDGTVYEAKLLDISAAEDMLNEQ